MIAENFLSVKGKIDAAVRRSGRSNQCVRLIAVSKTVPEGKIFEAIDAGATNFGENKVQDALIKIPLIQQAGIDWHFIGHLQKNKVKYIFDLFNWVHSLDEIELARAIDDGARKRDKVLSVLVQVNVSDEDSKSGIAPDQLETFLVQLAPLKGIRVKGLMTMAPMNPKPESARPYFSQLRELRDRVNSVAIENIGLYELSMGMSQDYEVAIEEGATMVRVGTAIFGSREVSTIS